MSLIVYNRSLDNFHEIAHAISVQMIEYYNDIGKLIMVLPIDDYNIAAIEKGGVLYDTERDMSFTIESYKYDTNRNNITVNGHTCNWLLNKRVIASKRRITAIESGVYQTVNENLRGLYRVSVGAAQGLQGTTQIDLYGRQLLDEIMPVLSVANIGNKMRWDADARAHVFELYTGRDLTSGIHAPVFSEEFGTVRNLVITSDDSAFKNYIYVMGELTDDTVIVVQVGTATGGDRYEKWLEGSTRQTDDETVAQFQQGLREKGYEEMARLVRRETFSVSIDPEEYKKVYDLGDIVPCVSSRFGVKFNSRIAGVKYTLDAKGEDVSLILGEPILTALSEVK